LFTIVVHGSRSSTKDAQQVVVAVVRDLNLDLTSAFAAVRDPAAWPPRETFGSRPPTVNVPRHPARDRRAWRPIGAA
jgi:hypothetical protein